MIGDKQRHGFTQHHFSVFYVYVLQSVPSAKEFYVGSTVNLKARLMQHNQGIEQSTRRYRPWRLVYYEAYRAESLARLREASLKHHGNAMKELKKRIGVVESASEKKQLRRGLKSGAGFTLIELLVAAAVFSVLFLVGTTVFTRVQSFQRGILTRQRVVADGRYMLEAMARTVRLGAIDYAYYQSNNINLSSPTDRLVIRDQLGNTTCYRLNSSAVETGADCVSTTALTPSDLLVQKFSLRITPRSNPYLPSPSSAADCRVPGNLDPDAKVCACTGVADTTSCWPDQRCLATGTTPAFVCKNAVTQPQVTILLTTQSTNAAPGEQTRLSLQTTVISRVYGR